MSINIARAGEGQAKQARRERTSSCKGQDGRPAEGEGSGACCPRGVWCGAVAAPCEQTDEGGCFSAPPATNLDAKPGQVAASGIGKLRVGSLFGLAAVALWSPGRREGRNQGGVNCNLGPFSRMRSRRVPVSRLGSRGPGGDARSLRCVRIESAIVRNRSRRVRHAGRETQNCRHFWIRRVFASQKCQQSQGSGGRGRETQNCRHFFGLVSGRRVSKVSTVTGIGGVVVAKPRIVVTLGLFLGRHVSVGVNSHRDRGGRGRETQNCRHFWIRLASLRVESGNSHRDRGGRGRETQNCRHFWTRLASSCLKRVDSHRDPGGRGHETQNCRHFWTRLVSSHLKSVNSHRDPGGSWSRNPEMSSLLDSSRFFASP